MQHNGIRNCKQEMSFPALFLSINNHLRIWCKNRDFKMWYFLIAQLTYFPPTISDETFTKLQ